MSDQNTLKLGDWNARCDVCGFKFKASKLKKRWDNLMVCEQDYEHRHPMDFFKGKPDDPSVSWTRPVESTDLTEYNGDEGKTLVVDTNYNIQNWNTDLTETRVVILSTANASKGDQFIIYKSKDDDNRLLITTTTLDSGNSV